MESNSKITFEVMVMSSEILKTAITQHNNFNSTNFEIIEVIDDQLTFCKIEVSKYKIEDIFNLGHRLSVLEHISRENGELDW